MSAGFPFDGDEGFYSAIGKLTISWAYVEFGLDWLIREIHEPLDGHKHIEPDAPISLRRKLRYLRRVFRTLSRLVGFSGRFEKKLPMKSNLPLRNGTISSTPLS